MAEVVLAVRIVVRTEGIEPTNSLDHSLDKRTALGLHTCGDEDPPADTVLPQPIVEGADLPAALSRTTIVRHGTSPARRRRRRIATLADTDEVAGVSTVREAVYQGATVALPYPGYSAVGRATAVEPEGAICESWGMSPSAKTAASDSVNEIATVRIELRDTDPLIWREVEVPTSITLKVLHDVIQVVMDWLDYHLWQFTIGGQRYGLPMDEDWGTTPRKEATKVRLRDVLKARKTTIDYLYDFGDSWEHRLTVTGVRAGDPEASYPRYVRGERNAPPEDCGGVPGFYELLDVLADPGHPGHADAREWADDYDPDTIDVVPIHYALARIANRRNAAKARSVTKTRRPAKG